MNYIFSESMTCVQNLGVPEGWTWYITLWIIKINFHNKISWSNICKQKPQFIRIGNYTKAHMNEGWLMSFKVSISSTVLHMWGYS